jgi:hypothetical protein
MTAIGSGTTESDAVTVPPFAVISGAQVERALRGQEKQLVDLVEATYLLHAAGDSVNPPSYFLRFPDCPSARIIALPASIGGPMRVDGVKWISSFPRNIDAGIPRASAVLILNDHRTGYPFACLEGSIISATRTAASAALAADRLSRGRSRPTRVGFFGTGLIARYIHTTTQASGSSPPATSWSSPPSLLRRTSRTCRCSTTTRWCCTCRCAIWRRRSCSPQPTSSTTSNTA